MSILTGPQDLAKLTPPATFGTNLQVSNLHEGDDRRMAMLTSTLKAGRQVVRLRFKGELVTDGITAKTFDNKEKLTVGIRLAQAEDQIALNDLLEKVEEASDIDLDEWTLRPIFKNDVIYLKVQLNSAGNGYAFASNLPMNPRKPNPDVRQFTPVEVEVTCSCYFNVSDHGCGVFFPVRRIDFLTTPSAPPPSATTVDVGTQTQPDDTSGVVGMQGVVQHTAPAATTASGRRSRAGTGTRGMTAGTRRD